MLLSEEKH